MPDSQKRHALAFGLLLLFVSACDRDGTAEEPWRNDQEVRAAAGVDVYGGHWVEGSQVVVGVTRGVAEATAGLEALMGSQPYRVVLVTHSYDELEGAMQQIRGAVRNRDDVFLIRIDPRLSKVVVSVEDPDTLTLEGVDPAIVEIKQGGAFQPN